MLAIADLLFDRSMNTAPDMSINQPKPGIRRIDFLAICPSARGPIVSVHLTTHDSSSFREYPAQVDDVYKADDQLHHEHSINTHTSDDCPP